MTPKTDTEKTLYPSYKIFQKMTPKTDTEKTLYPSYKMNNDENFKFKVVTSCVDDVHHDLKEEKISSKLAIFASL